MSDIRLGWKKSPWEPEPNLFKSKLVFLQDIADLSKWRPPTTNQLNSGSCVGHAVEGILVGRCNQYGIKLPQVQRISPTDIYNGGRYIDGTLSQDEGTYASSALTWLSKKGCLPYYLWPYKGFEKQSRPSKLDPEAAKYPLQSWEGYTLKPFRVTGGVEGIHAAMNEGHMVAIGVPWPDDWLYSTDGVLPKVKAGAEVAGGHEIYLWLSNWKDKVFFGSNSWGEDEWSYTGKVVPKGCFVMRYDSFDWFKSEGGYDANGVDIDAKVWGGSVPPAPTPTAVTSKIISGTLVWEIQGG